MGHNGKSVPLDALALSPHFLSNFSVRLCWMNVLFFRWDTRTHTHTFKYLIAPRIARDCCIIVAVTTRNNCTKQSIIYLYLLQSGGGQFNLFIKLNTIFSFPVVSKNSATYSNKYTQAVVHTEGLGGWSPSRFGISMLSALDMAQGLFFLWF